MRTAHGGGELKLANIERLCVTLGLSSLTCLPYTNNEVGGVIPQVDLPPSSDAF